MFKYNFPLKGIMNVFDALDITKGEKKVYKALITLKSSTTGPIYKEAQVSQSKTYEILNRLKKKGLASSISKNNITYWQPSNPTIYLQKLEKEYEELSQKKELLKKELPNLLQKETNPTDDAQVLTGYNGFRSCLFSFLNSFDAKDTFYVLGSPVEIPEPFHTFLQAFNKDRVKNNINAEFLYGENMREFATKLYSLPKTKLRFMKGLTPSTIAIGIDRIIIMTWENEGKFVIITGKEIAKSYKQFFKSLWSMSEE